MKKLMQWAIALCSAAMLAACGGGGGGGSAPTVATDATLEVNAATGPTLLAAMAGETFAFPGGVPALGTNASTSVTFQDPVSAAAAPRFTISSGGNTASGTVAFGSCIFRITASTFPNSHPLGVGKTITVNPCNFRVSLRGTPADGVATSRSVALLLGAAVSSGTSVTVQVNPGGRLVINGEFVGIVTLDPVTGAG